MSESLSRWRPAVDQEIERVLPPPPRSERAIALVEEACDHRDDVPLTDEVIAELAAFAEYVVERDV